MQKLLREPLVHFLLIGGLLFLWYGNDKDNVSHDPQRIVVTQAGIDHLIDLWQRKRGRLPSQEELRGLIEHQVREQVLYRQALAMGLDRNDTVIHRRLAQKLEFISADIATRAKPTDVQLQDYLQAHSERYQLPGHIEFIQLYFNTDKRGKSAGEDARKLLQELQSAPESLDLENAGDPFPLGGQRQSLSTTQLVALFGDDFAAQLADLPLNSWLGPQYSGYGMHLVRVLHRTASSMPPLDSVRARLRDDWQAQQHKKLNDAFYQNFRKNYEIIIEQPGETER